MVSSAQLQAIWKALSADVPSQNPFSVRQILGKIADDGWMFSYQVEDLCYDSDARALSHRGGPDLEELATALGYPWVSVYSRPLMRSINATGSQALSSVDAAAFLLDLEMIGFSFDATFLIDRLRSAIMKKRRITSSELTIFWAPKMRGKKIITLESDSEKIGGNFTRGKFPSGHRYEALIDTEGTIHYLTIKGPKHRHQASPVETVCPDCGDRWWRGDPDSSAAHRAEHKKRMHVLAPRPLPSMITAQAEEGEPELVTALSPAWKHYEMYQRARAFKREEGYDFVQWHSSDGEDDPKVHGFLLSRNEGTILGAIVFRWREPEGDPAFWGLQWAWVTPSARRSGILSSRWRAFRERFGDFHVEGPVSEGMRAFLAKQGDAHLMRWPSRRDQSELDGELPDA